MSEDIKTWVDTLDYDQIDAVDFYEELTNFEFTDEPYEDF